MATTSIQISVQHEIRARIDEQIALGRYASASEYVSDLVRDDQHRLGAIEHRLRASLADSSGAITLTAEDVLRGGVLDQISQKTGRN